MTTPIESRKHHATPADNDIPLIDRHFAQIAFAVSSLAHFILSPFIFILGSAAALWLHRSIDPAPKFKSGEPMITPSHAVLAIVGTLATFVKMTPAGLLGGWFFNLIPTLSYFAVGNALHRATHTI